MRIIQIEKSYNNVGAIYTKSYNEVVGNTCFV